MEDIKKVLFCKVVLPDLVNVRSTVRLQLGDEDSDNVEQEQQVDLQRNTNRLIENNIWEENISPHRRSASEQRSDRRGAEIETSQTSSYHQRMCQSQRSRSWCQRQYWRRRAPWSPPRSWRRWAASLKYFCSLIGRKYFYDRSSISDKQRQSW